MVRLDYWYRLNHKYVILDGQHYVTSVNSGSPAEEAGIRVYDKIIQINSITTDSLQNHQVLKLLCSAPDIELIVENDEA